MVSKTRIELFNAASPEAAAPGRQALACLQVVEVDPETGKETISASMNFFGLSLSRAGKAAEEWWTAEKARQAKLDRDRLATGQRSRKRASQ